MKKYFDKYVKAPYNALVSINASPRQVASGFAMGAFIGTFPTFGAGGLIAIGLCALLKMNYAATAIGCLATGNPLATPLTIIASTQLGCLIYSSDVKTLLEMAKNGMLFKSLNKFSLIYLTGNVIIAVILSAISFFAVKKITARKRAGKE